MAKIRNYEIEWMTVRIRPIKITLLVILIIGLFIGYWFWLRSPHRLPRIPLDLSASDATAHLIEAEGRVEVKTRERLSWEPAAAGTELNEGDKVRTGPDSLVKIVFNDQSEIVIEPESIAVIRESGAEKEESAAAEPKSRITIERGSGNINNLKGKQSTSVSTPRIAEFKLPPGSAGNARVERSGDVTEVYKGIGQVRTREGKILTVAQQQRVLVDNQERTRLVKLPGVPWLLSPPSGQVFEYPENDDLLMELIWRDVRNASRYQLQVSENRLFSKLSAERNNLDKSTISIRLPKTGQKKQFFWRVRSVSADNNLSEWSTPNQFVVQNRPELAAKRPSNAPPPPLSVGAIHAYFPYVQVEGKTAPGVFLRLNGQVIDVRQDGSFVYMYPLQNNGWNDLVFVAEDPYGVSTTVSRKVLYQ